MMDKSNSKNKLTLLIINENNYLSDIADMIKKHGLNSGKKCYVCLSKPCFEVIEELRNEQLDCNNCIFIDTISTPDTQLEPVKNLIFLSSAYNFDEIKDATNIAIKEHKCRTIIFDTVSEMLLFQKSDSIVRFTHDLIIDETQQEANKLFVLLQEGSSDEAENVKLIKDLSLFADRTIVKECN